MKKVRNFASLLRREGRLAQLVQSICLTSRGSAVRIRQRPQTSKRLTDCSVSLFFAVFKATTTLK